MSNVNDFIVKNGGSILNLEDDLVIEVELREKERIYWGSVYGGEYVEMPPEALVSESAYRKWCVRTSPMVPEKRPQSKFEAYIRVRIANAQVREVLPGTEYGIEVEETIDECTALPRRSVRDVDAGAEWSNDIWCWIETVDERIGQEVIIKIDGLMKIISKREYFSNTEVKVVRRMVAQRLEHYGRHLGRGESRNRLRSAYVLPIEFLDGGLKSLREREKSTVVHIR
jgi:hypothetical protein